MSITSVMKEVKTAIAGGTPLDREKLTQLEARRIVKEAKKNGVTAGEAKAVVDTYEVPRRHHTMAVGEGPSYRLTEAATKTFNQFFAELGVPAGESEEPVRQNIEAVMQNVGVNLNDYAVAAAPNTKHLVATRFYSGAVGGSLQTAYVDASKHQFYWSTQNASARTAEKFFGPFSLALEP
jgi:hypothetical protein